VAIVTNTLQTYQQKGIREELHDVIINISPADTPFLANAGKGETENTFCEWLQDELASPDATNARIEGDDKTSFDATSQPTRIGNYTQISDKSIVVSGTAEKVRKAGRKSDMAYGVAKKGQELKRDLETILIGTNQAGNAGATGTARKTASMLSFVRTNVDKEGTGANPAAPTTFPGGTRTDGATRAFTETILKAVIQLQWAQGGHCDTLMVGGSQKQVVSGFSGIATKTIQQTAVKAAAIIGAADIYVSDFGTFAVVPNRFQRNRDAWVLDFDLISVDWLRPIHKINLAKTGDAEKAMLLGEYMLKVKQEKGLGLAADLA
jgi:hypothetical protein